MLNISSAFVSLWLPCYTLTGKGASFPWGLAAFQFFSRIHLKKKKGKGFWVAFVVLLSPFYIIF